MLNKGDTCYVRNSHGEIEKCKYGYAYKAMHIAYDQYGYPVKVNRFKPKQLNQGRFVVMSGMRKEYVEAIK